MLTDPQKAVMKHLEDQPRTVTDLVSFLNADEKRAYVGDAARSYSAGRRRAKANDWVPKWNYDRAHNVLRRLEDRLLVRRYGDRPCYWELTSRGRKEYALSLA